MKLKNLLVAILTLFVVVSCKKESNQLETNSQTPNNNSFVFTVEFTANKTDTFSLFYTEDGSINFGEKVTLFQGDLMVRLFFNIWPFATRKISPIIYQIH